MEELCTNNTLVKIKELIGCVKQDSLTKLIISLAKELSGKTTEFTIRVFLTVHQTCQLILHTTSWISMKTNYQLPLVYKIRKKQSLTQSRVN